MCRRIHANSYCAVGLLNSKIVWNLPSEDLLGEINLDGRSEERQISKKQDKTIQDYQILKPVNIHLLKQSWNSTSSHSLIQK